MTERASIADIGAVKTAIEFIVKGVDRLEASIVRLESTVREDFATTAELEVVKAAVTELRMELNRRLLESEKDIDAKLAAHAVMIDTRLKTERSKRDTETRIARWLIRVAIPMGALAVLKFGWDIFQHWAKSGIPKP